MRPETHPHSTADRPAADAPTPGHERWARIGLGVRLAYNPLKPAVIRHWLCLGERLVAEDQIDELPMWRCAFDTLVQVARDAALPLAWRSAALDHAVRPAVRLAGVLRRQGAVARAAEVSASLDRALVAVEQATALALANGVRGARA